MNLTLKSLTILKRHNITGWKELKDIHITLNKGIQYLTYEIQEITNEYRISSCRNYVNNNHINILLYTWYYIDLYLSKRSIWIKVNKNELDYNNYFTVTIDNKEEKIYIKDLYLLIKLNAPKPVEVSYSYIHWSLPNTNIEMYESVEYGEESIEFKLLLGE